MLAELMQANLFVFFVVFARIGSAMILLPPFGEAFVFVRTRLVLALAISALATPLAAPSLPALPPEPLELTIILTAEILVGLFIGGLARILLADARDAMAGGGKLTIRTSNWSHDARDRTKPKLLAPRRLCADRGRRYRERHRKRPARPDLRTLLLDQGGRRGNRPRLVDRLRHRHTDRRLCLRRKRARPRATFSIYLPRYVQTEEEAADEIPAPVKPSAAQDLTGKGTILLVEDEDGVRVFGARALRNKGYTVIEADSGEAALAVMDSYDGEIDLLITDVVMPQMDGATLIQRVREIHPDFKVILISGYAEESFRERLAATKSVTFLPKPFSLNQLAGTVKAVTEA